MQAYPSKEKGLDILDLDEFRNLYTVHLVLHSVPMQWLTLPQSSILEIVDSEQGCYLDDPKYDYYCFKIEEYITYNNTDSKVNRSSLLQFNEL